MMLQLSGTACMNGSIVRVNWGHFHEWISKKGCCQQDMNHKVCQSLITNKAPLLLIQPETTPCGQPKSDSSACVMSSEKECALSQQIKNGDLEEGGGLDCQHPKGSSIETSKAQAMTAQEEAAFEDQMNWELNKWNAAVKHSEEKRRQQERRTKKWLGGGSQSVAKSLNFLCKQLQRDRSSLVMK
jgi:hypothetical protein